MKRFVAASFTAAASVLPLTGQAATHDLAIDVSAVASRPQLRSSQIGAAFYDLDAKRMLYARDANKYFVAASTTKILTESTSLALLGAGYRFTTNVYRTGAVDSS